MKLQGHECPDWDFLYVEPSDPEWECCTCTKETEERVTSPKCLSKEELSKIRQLFDWTGAVVPNDAGSLFSHITALEQEIKNLQEQKPAQCFCSERPV